MNENAFCPGLSAAVKRLASSITTFMILDT